MTVGLLAATSMAFASGDTLDQSDSTMLFGEKSSNVTTLNQDEMKETSGKYWYRYPYYYSPSYSYDDYYTSYDYDDNSITNVLGIGTTTAANQVTVMGGVVPMISTTTTATPVINGGTTIINN
jgi:hypothetical protein